MYSHPSPPAPWSLRSPHLHVAFPQVSSAQRGPLIEHEEGEKVPTARAPLGLHSQNSVNGGVVRKHQQSPLLGPHLAPRKCVPEQRRALLIQHLASTVARPHGRSVLGRELHSAANERGRLPVIVSASRASTSEASVREDRWEKTGERTARLGHKWPVAFRSTIFAVYTSSDVPSFPALLSLLRSCDRFDGPLVNEM